VNTFSLSEEFFRGHFTRTPVIPGVIYVEAMAQLLGWLITYSHDFRRSAIMSLIENVTVNPGLRPGFQARIHCEIISSTERDTLGTARMEANGSPIATLSRIIFSHFGVADPRSLREQFIYCSGWENLPHLTSGTL
jgi:3-hydroxymyristoyl/3-hydroxydecanoyl-(acyl carrier protein) dehydratase